MAEAGRVPVRESVGAALRFARESMRLSAIIAGVGALATTAISVISMQVPLLGLLAVLASTFVAAAVYAAFTAAALDGPGGLRQRLAADAGRVWAAMAVVAFFLVIVFVVLAIPGLIVLGAILAPDYGVALQNASGDEAASLALMQRIFTENPGLVLGYCLFYGAIWMALTSRLYLAAPASVDNKRILTFETWAWTKGNTLRIIGARLMLLGPAYVLVSALSYILAAALGVNVLDPASLVAFAEGNVAVFALFTLVSIAIQIFVYRSLEAGLSAYLYRGLKPPSGAESG